MLIVRDMYIYLVLVSICDHLSPKYLNFIESLHSLIPHFLNSSHPNLEAISDSAEACMEIKIHLQGEVVFLTDIGPCSCPSLGQIWNCLIHLAIAMNHDDFHIEFQEWS